MRFNDALVGLAFLVLSVVILVAIQAFPDFPGQRVGPAAFPGLLAVLLGGCSIALIWRGWRERQEQGVVAVGAWLTSPRHVRNFLVAVGSLIFYVAAADILGFLICGPLILIAMFSTLRVRPTVSVPLAVAVTVGIHLVFYKMLKVPLPWGLLPPLW